MFQRPPSFRILTTLIAILTICVATFGAIWGAGFGIDTFAGGLAFAEASSNNGLVRISPAKRNPAAETAPLHPAAASASSANYSFATITSGSLTDMSYGTSQLVGPDLDDAVSPVTAIGFDFYLMGNRYSRFSASSNGMVGLGSSAVDAATYSVSAGTSTTPILSAFGGDLRTGSAGKVHYKVTGTAPNRALTIEFLNMSLLKVESPGSNDGTYQVRLYESSGKIEFVYGSMSRNAGTGAQNGQSVGIGFATGSTPNSLLNVISATNTTNVTSPFVEQTYSAGTIANLNSSADGLRRVYSLTPSNTATPPTDLTFTDVNSAGMTLSWTDSPDEVGYAVYRSTDGGATYAFQGSTAADVTTLAVSALQPGQTYEWRVYSVSEGGLSLAPLAGSQATEAAGTTYFWVGSSGGDWNTAANWNTAADNTGTPRTTPNSSDVMIIDGQGTTDGADTTISISASETIGALRVTSNTACTLRSDSTTTRTLTITGNAGDDFAIQTGSALIFDHATDPVGIVFSVSTGMTGTIAGTLSFAGGASVDNSVNTTGGTETVVTVASTGVIDLGVQEDSMLVSSASTLVIADGGTVNSSGATTGAPPVPLATWGPASNLNISGLTTATAAPANNAQAFGNLTYDCPASVSAFNFFGGTTTGSIQGTLTVQSTNTGRFVAVSSGNTYVRNLIVNGGTFEASSAGGQVIVSGNLTEPDGVIDVSSADGATLKVAGDFNQSATGVLSVSNGTTNLLEFNGTSAQALTLANPVTGTLNVRVNNAAGVGLTGSLAINDNASLTISKGNITGSGTISYGTVSTRLIYNGRTGTQSATAVEFPAANGPVGLTIDNSSPSPNNTVSVPFNRTLPTTGVLTVASGILVNTGNVLTVSNTASGAIIGGSSASYVRGAIARSLPAGLTGTQSYPFPIGKGTFNPFELSGPVTSGTLIIKAEAFDTDSGGMTGTSMGSLNTDRYWAASIMSGSGLTSSFVKLTDASATSNSAIASSSSLNGTYDIVGGTSPAVVVGASVTSVAPAATTIPGFFVLGTVDTIPPSVTYAPLGNTFSTADRTLSVTLADATGIATGGSGPRIYYRNGTGGYFSNACSLATGTVNNGTWDCTILAADVAPAATNVISYFVIAQDRAGNVTSNPSAGLVAANVNTVTTPPTLPNPYTIVSRFSGSVNVGSGEAITSLTSPGGLFEQIDQGSVNGDLTVNITSDLISETGAVSLNQAVEEGAGNWTITFKPATAPLVISGSAPTCLINLDGADRIVFDGAVSGNSKDTTVSNTNTSGATVCIANGANNNTFKNLILRGVSTSASNGVVYFSGTTSAAGNSGNLVSNNTITSGASEMARGVYMLGTSGKNGDSNSIVGNVINDFSEAGIYLDNYYANTSIGQNSISEASAQTSTAITGIYINNSPGAASVSRNRIFDLDTTGVSPTIRAIYHANGMSGDAVNVVNNFIYLDSTATTDGASIYGLENSSSSGVITNFLNNSVRIGGAAVTSGSSSAVYHHGPGTFNATNNILWNARSNGVGTGGHFAIRVDSTGQLATFASNYNDLFASGSGGSVGTTDGGATVLSTLSNWQSATSGDTDSIYADPQVISPTDLHITYQSPAKNSGVILSTITDDIDGDARPKDGGYDIGADEYVDNNAPDTTITGNPANPANSATAVFTFAGTDALAAPEAVASFQCKLDSGSYGVCTSPTMYNGLADGSHTFYVYALDASGNADATPAQYTWVIDTVAPDTTITSQPSDPTNSTSASFSFTGSDPGGTGVAGFTCKLDSDASAACNAGTASYSGLAEGLHSFTVFAADNAGNADTSPASYSWTVDLTPPETTIDTFPSNPTNATTANFTFSAANFAAGAATYSFACSLDAAPFTPCVSPASLSGLSDGPHNFRVKATDAAGNEDPTPASYTWVVDTVAPVMSIDAPTPADPSNTPSGSFNFSGTDTGGTGVASFLCSLDGSAYAVCTSPYSYSALIDGPHTFAVKALDAAGNASATVSFAWVIDTVPPDTMITGQPSNPTNSSSATFTFANIGSRPQMGTENRPSVPQSVTFECSLDNAALSSCVSGVNYTGLTDGSHNFEVRARDMAGNVDPTPASYTWVVDTALPVASIDTPTPANPSNSASGSFNFSGTDTGGTGVASFLCSLDGATYTPCKSPRPYGALADGSQTFAVKAVDAAGNTSNPASFTWVIDTTPPIATINPPTPPDPSASPSATFNFSATDTGGSGVSGFLCSIDGGIYALCTSPKSLAGLTSGSHTFAVKASDVAGNQSDPATFTWVVDLDPPDTTITANPGSFTNSTSATFSFTGTDLPNGPGTVASFHCKLDAGSYGICTSPKTYTGLAVGSHTFSVFSVDTAGNSDPTPATFTWVIDTTPPTVSIDDPKPPDPSNSTSATLRFAGTDPGGSGVTGFLCSFDGGTYAACTSPKMYTGLADGSHTFSVKSVDAAGNQSSPASYTWVVDTVAPDTSILSGPPDPSYDPDASFTFTNIGSFARGKAAGKTAVSLTFECKLDAGSFVACTSPQNYTGLANGSHTFQVRAIDAAGNADPTPAIYTWTVSVPAGPVVVFASSGNTGPTSYSTLKSAFDAINSGVHGGELHINISGDTIEQVTAILNASGAGAASYTSITIQPFHGARTISGSIAGPLVFLNGADNVTINGVNSGGNSLTISNSSLGAASAVGFINDATNNIITRATLRGSATSASGVVYFGAGASTGNSNNNINNCNIAAAGSNLPINGIYSAGSVDNTLNTIDSNNISEFFNASAASNGIYLAAGSSAWTITNNRFFQTGFRSYTAAAVHSGINIAAGSGYSIAGNIIGYSGANGGGYYFMGGSAATRFVGINLAVGPSPATSVQGNSVSSIILSTTSGASTGCGVLCGVNITSGNVNVGSVTPNIIGMASGTDSLIVTPSVSQAAVVGINAGSTGTTVISNNIFGGLTSATLTSSISGAVFGINVSADAASITITGNMIGTADQDSLRAGVLSTTTASSLAGGINQTGVPAVSNYSNNTIRNLSSFGSGNTGYVRGIQTPLTASDTASATISGNTISNLTTNSTLTGETGGIVSAVGIHFYPGTGAVISGNTISAISNTNNGAVGTVVAGIAHAAATNTTISANRVSGLSNSSSSNSIATPGIAAGILLWSGTTTITVVNNMVALGSGQFANTVFIGIWAAHGATPDPMDKIYFNSVSIQGTVSAGGLPTMAFERGDLGPVARTVSVDIRNNILSNIRTGSTGKHYAISNNYGAPSSSVSGWVTGASNYNVLNANSANVGFWSSNQTFAGWRSASSGDGNSYTGVPITFSASDLHINMGSTPTALESGGTPIPGFTTDFDGDIRPGPAGSTGGGAFAPDIGADEFDGVYQDNAPPIINYTPLVNLTSTANRTFTISTTDGSGVAQGGNAPRVYYKRSVDPAYVSSACSLTGGTNQVGTFTCVINYAFTANGHATLGETYQYFVVAQDLLGNLSANPSAGFAGTNVIGLTSPPTTPNSYKISSAFSGNYSVSSFGFYNSLTNPGGLFEAINGGVATGNISIAINSDLTGETGAVALNQVVEEGAGGYTVTIKPSGGPRTISGSSAGSLIKLFGADRVIIDGSLSAGTDRSLTIANSGSGAVIWIATNASSGANNDTIKNTLISGPGAFSGQGIVAGSGASLGGLAENGRPNSNNTIQNNLIKSVQNAVFTAGDTATPDQNWLITGNDLGSSVTSEKLSLRGVSIQNAQNFQVTQNRITGVASSASSTATVTGVSFSGIIGGGTIDRNEIRDVKQKNAAGYGSNGIWANAISTAANVTITNNFISDISSAGTAGPTSSDNGYGIMIDSGAGYKIYHNTVNMNTSQPAPGSVTAAVNVAAAVNTPGGIDLRDNILANTETVGARYGVYLSSSPAVFSFIDYNDYFANHVGFYGIPAPMLGDWATATGQDGHSYKTDPLFVAANDLHLQTGSPMIDHAFTLPGITVDFDGQPRPVGMANDIGADEYMPPTIGPPATVSGQIVSLGGRGIGYAFVMLTDNTSGATVFTVANPFGYYILPPVPTNVSYTVTVSSKAYTFTPNNHVFTLAADRPAENFTSDQ